MATFEAQAENRVHCIGSNHGVNQLVNSELLRSAGGAEIKTLWRSREIWVL
jgi:hypothetical protein